MPCDPTLNEVVMRARRFHHKAILKPTFGRLGQCFAQHYVDPVPQWSEFGRNRFPCVPTHDDCIGPGKMSLAWLRQTGFNVTQYHLPGEIKDSPWWVGHSVRHQRKIFHFRLYSPWELTINSNPATIALRHDEIQSGWHGCVFIWEGWKNDFNF